MHPPRLRLLFDFDVVTPDQNDVIIAAADGTVPVEVFNRDPTTNTGFLAWITDINNNNSSAQVQLRRQSPSQRWLSVPGIDATGGGNLTIPQTDQGQLNRIVHVVALQQGSVTTHEVDNQFDVAFAGSGSGGVPLDGLALNFGRLIPVTMQLRLDSPVRPGTCSYCDQLNAPTLLVYSHDVQYAGCWFSQPIELCADGTAPAWWMLQTKDARTWTLVLRRDKVHVVTYGFAPAAANKVSFPLKLHILGPGGKECKNWPLTVTIAPG